MNNDTDYMIITNPSLSVLQQSVNQMIDEGYMPCGGIAAFEPPMSVGVAFAQAMVRYNVEANKINELNGK